MTSKKLQIIKEISEAEDCLSKAQLLAEAYPFVQDLLQSIIEHVSEAKTIVKAADEIVPVGQTTITDSLEEENIGYTLQSLRGE